MESSFFAVLTSSNRTKCSDCHRKSLKSTPCMRISAGRGTHPDLTLMALPLDGARKKLFALQKISKSLRQELQLSMKCARFRSSEPNDTRSLGSRTDQVQNRSLAATNHQRVDVWRY